MDAPSSSADRKHSEPGEPEEPAEGRFCCRFFFFFMNLPPTVIEWRKNKSRHKSR